MTLESATLPPLPPSSARSLPALSLSDSFDSTTSTIAPSTMPSPSPSPVPTRNHRDPHDPWSILSAAAFYDGNDGSLLRSTLHQMEPDLLKRLLILHANRCSLHKCTTCSKMRSLACVARRRRKLWRKFRALARAVGSMALLRRRAAARVYAPGGPGYLEALEEWSTCAMQEQGSEECTAWPMLDKRNERRGHRKRSRVQADMETEERKKRALLAHSRVNEHLAVNRES